MALSTGIKCVITGDCSCQVDMTVPKGIYQLISINITLMRYLYQGIYHCSHLFSLLDDKRILK